MTLAGACATDAPSTRAGLVPLACDAAPVTYLLDSVYVPVRSGEGSQYGLDLDGDDRDDNALAQAALGLGWEHADFAPSTAATAALGEGRVAWALSITTCDGAVRVDLGQASDADRDGRYVLAPGDAIPAAGTAVAGRISARYGRGAAPLATLADTLGTFADVGWTSADALALEVDTTGDQLAGTLAFAIPMPDSRRTIAGPLAAYFTALLRAGDSAWAAMLDADHDGMLCVDEFLADVPADGAHGIVGALLAPDLTLYGEGGRYGDSEDRPAKALSAGIGIHAHVVPTE